MIKPIAHTNSLAHTKYSSQAFKSKHGHCYVPQKYVPNPSLGGWVARQRHIRRKWEDSHEGRTPCDDHKIDCDVKSPLGMHERMNMLRSIGLSSSIGKFKYLKVVFQLVK